MREAQVNLAMRWFAGYRLTDRLPDHSSLTRIRQRWGPECFARVFRRSVSACAAAGLIHGETIHIDATLIRADVSWESLTDRHVKQVLAENAVDAEPLETSGPTELSRKKSPKKFSPTDPDATLTTSCKQYRMEPSYKQHTAVDDRAGVIVDVQVTTGEASEGRQLPRQIERIEAQTGMTIRTATADGAYAHSANYAMLESRGTRALIPPQPERISPGRIPARRFRYDARHDIVRCPTGRTLVRSAAMPNGHMYRARAADCRRCPLRPACVPPSASSRCIAIVNHYESLLRARRHRRRWGEAEQELYRRHRWRVEGIHGEAKTQHGLRRAARRGIVNVSIQVYLTAAVMNLKRLAAPCAERRRYAPIFTVARACRPTLACLFGPARIDRATAA